MNFFRVICIFALPAILFSACSTARQGEAVSKQPKNSAIKDVNLPEPVGAAGKTSWLEYKSGKQAAEAEDILTAIYYFDLALSELYTEQRADSLGQPEDSTYFSTMPNRIIRDLESLYPKLLNQTQTQAFSLNDYESIDDFEETPIDSAEKEVLENFLDATDLSKFSLPLTVNARVMQEIHFLTVNARTFTEGSLSRKTALDSMIYAKLKQRNMPEDLIYLAFIESGFKVHAYSRAKAAGVWQFIPSTGKRYGLPVDFWLDMRRNPEAATDAALSYLSDLYDEFGDWYLAMAAYNCGEGRIRRLVKEGSSDSSKKVSYWDLKLPRETMLYVPRILAAAIIGHFPENYSFTVEKQSLVPFDTVTIKDCIPLDKAGAAVGASVNTMRDLNPELTRWCTPPNLKAYTMKVPLGSREKFLAAYEKMDKTQLVRWQQYKVQKGDNLGQISRLFGLRVADIQAANNLRNAKLSVGQVLIIPMPTGANPPEKQKQQVEKYESAAALAKKQLFDAPTEKTSSGLSIRSYVVRRGDNLSSISRRFGISSQNLMAWNNLQNNKVMIGQRLYLQDPKKDSPKNEGLAITPITPKEIRGTSYIIKQGDNLWEIARNNNVTVQQLLEWNPGLDKKIYPGMKIKIGD